MRTKDLLLLAAGAKYIIIFCFIALLYNSVSVSVMLDQKIDWTELAYICVTNIVGLWLIVKIEKFLKLRNSLSN